MSTNESGTRRRGAVVGLGMVGRHHARLLQSSERVDFAGGVDPDGDVGLGPEEKRLMSHARELGLKGLTEFRPSVPYDEMPRLYREASGMVLGSLPRGG